MLRECEGDPIMGTLPASTAQVIYQPVKISAVDAASGAFTFAKPVDGEKIDGFLLKPVQATVGTPDATLLWGDPVTTGEYATYVAGKVGSAKLAEFIELEGSDYLEDGITATVGTEVAMSANGKFEDAASTNIVQYKVKAVQTPMTAGATRLVLQKVNAYVKA
jgi:hypothetical protein